jgi:hypothetical protein
MSADLDPGRPGEVAGDAARVSDVFIFSSTIPGAADLSCKVMLKLVGLCYHNKGRKHGSKKQRRRTRC